MTLPLRNNLGRFPHPWFRRFEMICRRCWNLVLSSLARVHGAMLGVGQEEGWRPAILYWLLLLKCTHTQKSYPLPRIQEALESLVGAGYFSCLDLKLGFWQIKMEEPSKQYTAFTVGNLGFFKCDRMPFGLCNVLATFRRLMQNCHGELNLIYCLIYLDDIITDCRRTPPQAICAVWLILGV